MYFPARSSKVIIAFSGSRSQESGYEEKVIDAEEDAAPDLLTPYPYRIFLCMSRGSDRPYRMCGTDHGRPTMNRKCMWNCSLDI